MAHGQSNIMRFPAGQRVDIGPRYVWNPSTGNRLNLSGWWGLLRCKDYAGGTTVFAVSTAASTAAGRLKFSVAASGAYYVKLLPAATSSYGGMDLQYDLRISTPLRLGPLVVERGKIVLEDTL